MENNEKIVFSEEEIRVINTFVKNVQEMPIVECVYMYPHWDFKTNKNVVNIVTVWSMNEDCFNIDAGQKMMHLLHFIEEANEDMSDGKVCFETYSSDVYNVSFASTEAVVFNCSLANSIILYDRAGKMADKKSLFTIVLEENSKTLLNDHVDVENLEEILRDGQDKK